MPARQGPQPFRIEIPDADVQDLRQRVDRFRPGGIPVTPPWDRGTSPDFLSRLVEHWRTAYDWRAAEREINAVDHWQASIDAIPLHFVTWTPPSEPIGARQGPSILLLHGWPSSFWEFRALAPILCSSRARPRAVVAPSLPGFGFSPPRPGCDAVTMSELMHRLMTETLGFDEYVVHGGDFGALVGSHIAHRHPESVLGLHLDVAALRPRVEEGPPASAEEAEYLAAVSARAKREDAYAYLHMTKPNTLGPLLNDSPVGFTSWVVEKLNSWIDHDDDLESVIGLDDIITHALIHWLPGTAASGIHLYADTRRSHWYLPAGERLTVPTAYARWPREIVLPPRSWVERVYPIVRWTEFDRGGHFAAMERPADLAEDIAAFVSSSLT